MENTTNDIERMLREAGWYPGRSIDVTITIGLIEESGYAVSQPALQFLREYGELRIADKTTVYLVTIHDQLDFGEDELKPIAQYLQLDLCPVANSCIGWVLVDTDGKFYHTDAATRFLVVGESPGEAIENIIHARFMKNLIDENVLGKIVPPYG